jgi:cytochrome c553
VRAKQALGVLSIVGLVIAPGCGEEAAAEAEEKIDGKDAAEEAGRPKEPPPPTAEPGEGEGPAGPSRIFVGLEPREPGAREMDICSAPAQVEREGVFSTTYASACENCHGDIGQGSAIDSIPPLPSTLGLDEFRTIVRSGAGDAHRMPPFNAEQYPDAELEADWALLALSQDQRRGAVGVHEGFDFSVAMDREEADARIREGLRSWRLVGDKGACASCHGPVGADLARIKFTRADILRRCTGNGVEGEHCQNIADMVDAVRSRLEIDQFCEKDDRILQPGGSMLEGDTAEARDAALIEELERIGMPLATERYETIEDYRDFVATFEEVGMMNVRVGFEMNPWTQDRHFGDPHHSNQEWIPEYAREPRAEFREEIYAAHNAYIEHPTDLNLWAMLEVSTDPEKTTTAPGYVAELYDDPRDQADALLDRMAAWGIGDENFETLLEEHPTEAWRTEFTNYNANKYSSVLVAGHLMLDNVARMPTIGTDEEIALLEANNRDAKRAMKARGADAIWSVGSQITSGCVDGCWAPHDFWFDMSDSAAQTTRSSNGAADFRDDIQRTGHNWQWMATMLDPAQCYMDVSNEYFFNVFQRQPVGDELPMHNLLQRFMVQAQRYAGIGDGSHCGSGKDLTGRLTKERGGPLDGIGALTTSYREMDDDDVRAYAWTLMSHNALRLYFFALRDELETTGVCDFPNEEKGGVMRDRHLAIERMTESLDELIEADPGGAEAVRTELKEPLSELLLTCDDPGEDS